MTDELAEILDIPATAEPLPLDLVQQLTDYETCTDERVILELARKLLLENHRLEMGLARQIRKVENIMRQRTAREIGLDDKVNWYRGYVDSLKEQIDVLKAKCETEARHSDPVVHRDLGSGGDHGLGPACDAIDQLSLGSSD